MPRILLSIFFSLALLLPACNTDGDDLPATSPGEAQAGVSGDLVASPLSDVPLPPAAEPAGTLQEEDGRITQSYIVTASTADEVNQFYVDELPANGWSQKDLTVLDEGYRALWTNETGAELLVATLDQTGDVDLSLQLTSAVAVPPTDSEE